MAERRNDEKAGQGESENMIVQSAGMAWHAVTADKLRSFLTMLGIMVGVTALVVLVSLVNGAASSVTDEISGMGRDALTVKITDDKGNPMKLKDLEQVQQLEEISQAAPLEQGSATGERGSTSSRVILYGTTAAYMEIQKMELESGRFLRTFDVENHTYNAVLNQTAAKEFFGSVQKSQEQSFNLNGIKFRVAGVLAEEESVTGDTSERMEVYIPYTTMLRMTDNSSGISSFYVQAVDEESQEPAQAALEQLLLDRYAQDDEAFTIINESAIRETMGSVNSTFALLLGGIAGISLLVGGIGIMNIMLVSVTERTREIGIRKAIGATRRSIMIQFMLEALMISLLGCGIGIALSWIILKIAGLVSGSAFSMSGPVLAVAVGFSAAVGLMFGIYPAAKAADKNPIEALRQI